nr:MAG TPA: hypothetical protein [Caudoviricetes sp.]
MYCSMFKTHRIVNSYKFRSEHIIPPEIILSSLM